MHTRTEKASRRKEVLPAWKLRFFEVGILEKVPEFDAYYIGTDWIYHAALDPDPVETEWQLSRKNILKAWITRNPGTRPYAWWCFEAPGTRQRVGGTGTPKHEVLKYAPVHEYGIPSYWITSQDTGILTRPGFRGKLLDANDPPLYESQAAFLDRHGLMSDREKATLPKDAFNPEAVVRTRPASR